jgi:hypothetical protein
MFPSLKCELFSIIESQPSRRQYGMPKALDTHRAHLAKTQKQNTHTQKKK